MKMNVEEREVIKTNGIGYYATQNYVSQKMAETELDNAFRAYTKDYSKYIEVKLSMDSVSKYEVELYGIARKISVEAFKKGHGIEPDREVIESTFADLSKYFTIRTKGDLFSKFGREWEGSNQQLFLDEIVTAIAYLDSDTMRNLIKAKVLHYNSIEIGEAGYIGCNMLVPYYITAYKNFAKSGYHIMLVDVVNGKVSRIKVKDIIVRDYKVYDAVSGLLIADFENLEEPFIDKDYIVEDFGSISLQKRKKTDYYEICLGSTMYHKKKLNEKTHIKNHLLIMLMQYGYDNLKYPFCFASSSFLVIDHIDGNGLNNRLENLQMISNEQNIRKFAGDKCFNFANYFTYMDEVDLTMMQIKLIA